MSEVHKQLFFNSISIVYVPVIELIHAAKLVIDRLNEVGNLSLLRYPLSFPEGNLRLDWLKHRCILYSSSMLCQLDA